MKVTNPLKGLNILIVEDEFLVATQLTRMIQDLGGRVLGPVSTVIAGTELLQKSAVDGAVVDINLGKESSASLAEELLARGVPLVLTTGYSEDMLPDALAQVPRISKPYTKSGFHQIAAAHFVRHKTLMHTPEGVNERHEWQAFVSDLHHRLKNHLQMITSVIALQQSRITDPQITRAVRATHNRVRAIAGIFGSNSTSDLTAVHFGDYLDWMIRELAAEYAVSNRVQAEIRTADLAVDIEQAIPLALITNELAANAFEHAYPGDARGKISVTLSYGSELENCSDSTDEYGVLEVADDGVPLPSTFDLETAESTGFYLVSTLTSQLRAKMMVAQRASCKIFRLTFPIEN